MNKTLTKEEVELFAAGMVKRGELIWAGFRQDEDEKYTIPELTPSEWKLIRALLATQQPVPRDEVTEDDRLCAERYRWLRKEHFPTADNPPLAQVVWKELDDRHGNKWANMIDGNDLDRAIDAARAGEAS